MYLDFGPKSYWYYRTIQAVTRAAGEGSSFYVWALAVLNKRYGWAYCLLYNDIGVLYAVVIALFVGTDPNSLNFRSAAFVGRLLYS